MSTSLAKIKDIQGMMIKIRMKADSIDEMKREIMIVNSELNDKANNNELERFQRQVSNEYATLRAFTQLQ